MSSEASTDAAGTAPVIRNTSLDWVDQAACADLEGEAGHHPLGLFFVDAGHMIADATLNVCRTCPVRRECIIHFYTGGLEGGPINGGYGGGFSLGQRRQMTLKQALARAATEEPIPTLDDDACL